MKKVINTQTYLTFGVSFVTIHAALQTAHWSTTSKKLKSTTAYITKWKLEGKELKLFENDKQTSTFAFLAKYMTTAS